MWSKIIAFVFAAIFLVGCEGIGSNSSTMSFTGNSGRTWHVVKVGHEAKFKADHAEVDIWVPKGVKNPPIMIYAHGGSGMMGSDQARVSMFRQRGFVTISFNAFNMNGFYGSWVSGNVLNDSKQQMVLTVMAGAYKYAITRKDWDTRNIFIYGQSNGAMAAINLPNELSLPSELSDSKHIRGIIAEGMAATGLGRPDPLTVPTRLYYGKQDEWGGGGVAWKRDSWRSLLTMEEWVKMLQNDGSDIKFVFYENAGHSFHYGDLESRWEQRGGVGGFSASLGAGEGVVEQYTKDIFRFVNRRMVK